MLLRAKKISISAFASLGAFLITLLAFFSTRDSIREKERLDFENQAYLVRQSIAYHLQNYLNVLVQTRSMFYSSKTVSREEFELYVDNLDILNIYPSIQGLGYVEKVLDKDLKAHEEKIRREGFPDYHVWPTFKRREYYSIVYLEPFDWRNQKAFGYDMFTEEDRHVAMAGARDTGLPYMTGRVVLVQETDVDIQYGFLIYVPLYFSTENLRSVEERRKNLRGFIYSPFRANNFFGNVLKDYEVGHYGIEIYISDVAKDNIIYADHRGNEGFVPKSIKTSNIEFGGNEIIIKFFSYPLPSTDFTPYIILALGSFFSMSLFWLVWKHLKNARLERERARNYEALNRIGKLLSAELDLKKLVQFITNAGLELSHGVFGAFFYYRSHDKEEDYTVYSQADSSHASFEKFPFDSFKEKFAPVFKGERAVLFRDLAKEPISFNSSESDFQVRSLLGVPVVSRSGKVLGALFYGHNIPNVFQEREQMLIEGIASQAAIAIDNALLHKETKEAVATRDEFLSIASHELKTPITSMKLQFQLATKLIQNEDPKAFNPAFVAKRVALANIQLDRMSKLVEDMLDSTRFASRSLELSIEEVDLVNLVQTSIDILTPLLDKSNITLNFNKMVEEAKVRGDKHRLTQVVNNFISNAMKYGDGNPITIHIDENDKHVILKVQDHGIGIPEDKLDKIFELYERAVPSSNISGLGLGLFIANEVIKAHGGNIKVESKLGQGSAFYMILPKLIS